MHQTPGISPQSQIFFKTMGAFSNILAGAWATSLGGRGVPSGGTAGVSDYSFKFFMRTSAQALLLPAALPFCIQAS